MHTHTFWHLEACKLCTSTLPDIVVPKSERGVCWGGGQLNRRCLPATPRPVWGFLSLFKSKGTQNTSPVPPALGYIKNTGVWRWPVELPWFSRLQDKTKETRLQHCCCSTSLLHDGLFVGEQFLEWRVNRSLQAAPLDEGFIIHLLTNYSNALMCGVSSKKTKQKPINLKPVWSTL